MAKGIASLSYLPKVDILFPAANAACSIEALKGAAFLVAKLQQEGAPNGTYTNLIATGNNPYDQSVWTITVSGTADTFSCAFVSEVSSGDTGAQGRAALSTRRNVDVVRDTGATFDFTVRSLLAVLNFVEDLEDLVAKTGVSTTGDATYTDIPVKGHTPYDSFQWTVTKAGAVYTLVSTVNS